MINRDSFRKPWESRSSKCYTFLSPFHRWLLRLHIPLTFTSRGRKKMRKEKEKPHFRKYTTQYCFCIRWTSKFYCKTGSVMSANHEKHEDTSTAWLTSISPVYQLCSCQLQLKQISIIIPSPQPCAYNTSEHLANESVLSVTWSYCPFQPLLGCLDHTPCLQLCILPSTGTVMATVWQQPLGLSGLH